MRSIIPRALTLLLVLFSILFVVMGLRWLVNPAGSAPQLGLTLETGAGLSSQVGDLSAFFLVAGLSGLIALVSRAKETKRALNNNINNVARYGGFRAKGSGSGKGFGPDYEGFVLGEKVGLLSGEELRSWSTGRLRKTLDALEKERREIEKQIRFASRD